MTEGREMARANHKLINLLQKQIDVEKRTLENVTKAENSATEAAVKLVFMNMRLSTWKHQKFLESLIGMMNEIPCDEWSAKVARYTGRVKLERSIKEFINDESEMIDLLNQSIDEIDDPFGKFLLEHLREEEKRHHEDLEKFAALVKQAPLQPKKGVKGTDIVCESE